jgi:hypothetical protein
MKYPPPCENCAPDGYWALASSGSMKRCDCPRGRALADADQFRTSPPASEFKIDTDATLSEENAMVGVMLLSDMDFYPPERLVRMKIADELRCLCRDYEEMDWLVTKMIRIFTKWPKIPALRQVFFTRYLPLDGIKPIGICEAMLEAYPDGIPVDHIEAPAAGNFKAIAPPEFAATIKQITEMFSMDAPPAPKATPPKARRAPEKPERKTKEFPDRPSNPNFKPITQADIDRAVEKLRETRGRRELYGESNATPETPRGDDQRPTADAR